MKILFLSPVVPYPPLDGDRQRSWHILQHLAKKHEVHAVCFVRTAQERQDLEKLKTRCAGVTGVWLSGLRLRWNCAAAWLTSAPLNVAAFRSRGMAAAVHDIIRKQNIDVVHAYRLRMAPYALQAPTHLKVLDYTDSLSRYFAARVTERAPWWKKIYLQRELRAVSAYEVWASRQFQACLISSPDDQAHLDKLGAEKNLVVVSNGVEYNSRKTGKTLPVRPCVLFVGNLEYAPNRLGMQKFCSDAWPRIRAVLPQAQLMVIGKNPRPWRFAPGQEQGVEWLGAVPSLEPYFHQARVAICPVDIAAGRQFKVIEYLAAGLATVCTSVVAANLQAGPGREVLIADTAETFAQQVIRLCQDDRLAQRLGSLGRSFVQKHYTWDSALAALDQVYQGLRNGQKRRRKK